MTANQINFANSKETKRHNLETERQKERDLAIGERTAWAAEQQAITAGARQREDARHNLESETINWFQTRGTLAETQRSNLANEEIKRSYNQQSLAETSRHNFAIEGIQDLQARTSAYASQVNAQAALRNAAVNERHAAVSEGQLELSKQGVAVDKYNASTARLNAQASQTSAAASYLGAQAAMSNAATRANELDETIRRNTISLAETQRHNEAQEQTANKQATTQARGVVVQGIQARIAARNAATNERNAETNRFAVQIKAAESVKSTLSQLGAMMMMGG